MAIWSIHNTPVITLVHAVTDKSRGGGKLEYRIFEGVEGAKARKANTEIDAESERRRSRCRVSQNQAQDINKPPRFGPDPVYVVSRLGNIALLKPDS